MGAAVTPEARIAAQVACKLRGWHIQEHDKWNHDFDGIVDMFTCADCDVHFAEGREKRQYILKEGAFVKWLI